MFLVEIHRSKHTEEKEDRKINIIETYLTHELNVLKIEYFIFILNDKYMNDYNKEE